MSIKEAIKKAIEGGFELRPKGGTEIYLNNAGHNWKEIAEYNYLDPLFWQALGKSLGWKKNKGCQCCHKVECDYSTTGCPWYQTEEYIYHWHRFIDYLVEGKNAESFFEELK